MDTFEQATSLDNFIGANSFTATTSSLLASYKGVQVRQLLAAILDVTPVMMCYLDTDFRYILVSKNLAVRNRTNPEEMIGKTPYAGKPHIESFLRPILERIISTGQPYQLENVCLDTNSSDQQGQTRWNLFYAPVFGDDHNIIGIVSIAEEVTGQVLQRERLEQVIIQEKKRTAQLETILGSITEGIVVVDQTGMVILSNRVADELMEIPLLGVNLYQDTTETYNRRHLDGRIMRRDEAITARVMRGEAFVDFRYVVKNANGEDFYVSSTGAPMYDDDNRLIGGVLLFRDVTQQEQQHRELEEAYRATDETQNALLELAAAAVGITNLEELTQRIVEIVPRVTGCDRVGIALYNRETEESIPTAVYGIPEEKVPQWRSKVGKRDRTSPYDKAIYEDHQTLIIDFEAVVLQYKEQGIEIPNEYNIKQMMILPIAHRHEFIGMLTLDHGGKLHEFTQRELRVLEGMARLAAIAIQNVRLLQEASDAATLREANRLKDEFMSLIAHELRNPLTTIKGYTQMTQRQLRKAGTPENQLRYMDTIIEQSERMKRLVEDLSDLSRIEAGRFELRVRQANLAELIQRIADTYQTTAAKHKISFSFNNNSLSQTFDTCCDPDRIGQVISNLISNAVKYSPEGGLVELKLQVQPLGQIQTPNQKAQELGQLFLHFSIKDEGIGIPLNQQVALFERFYRASNSRDSNLPGLGLGLHISKQIIALHGGQMWVESAGENQGSTFHFIIPCVENC